MSRTCKYRDVLKALHYHDKRFTEYKNRVKGSEQIIFHPDIKGKARSIPIKCHRENTEIGVGMLKSIIRRFELPLDIFDKN